MQYYQDREETGRCSARQRRHRAWPGTRHGDHAAGHTVYETDLFRPFIDARPRSRNRVRPRRADRLRPAHRGGPRARRDVPGRRRRGARQRGAGLRHAPDRAARRAIRPEAGDQERVPGPDRRARHRKDAGAVPGAAGEAGRIVETIVLEESRFADTLESGSASQPLDRAGEGARRVRGGRAAAVPAPDTFGFPFELSEEMLAEGLTADRAGLRNVHGGTAERGRATAASASPRTRRTT